MNQFYTSAEVKKAFHDVMNTVEKNINLYVLKPGHDMSRSSKLGIRNLIPFLCTLKMQRISTELDDFFNCSYQIPPTKSAVTQQRSKLNEDLFPFFFNEFNRKLPPRVNYRGFNLLAVDGSDINLPTLRTDTENFMPYASKNGGFYQIHLNACFNLCTSTYQDVVFQPRPSFNEGLAFCTMVDRCSLKSNTIFIADRGYISYNNMAHVIEKDNYFLFRAKKPDYQVSLLKKYLEPGVIDDRDVSTIITRKQANKHKAHPETYTIIKKHVFDFIDVADKNTEYPMQFRAVCIDLGESNYEYLVTNLPRDKFPPSELKKLYHMRWGIETSFRRLKYALALSYLHSVKRPLIRQEIYAKMILFNIISLITAYAESQKETRKKRKKEGEYKWEYNVAWENAASNIRKYLTQWMPEQVLLTLLLRNMTPVRPDRHAPRNIRSKTSNPLNSRA